MEFKLICLRDCVAVGGAGEAERRGGVRASEAGVAAAARDGARPAGGQKRGGHLPGHAGAVAGPVHRAGEKVPQGQKAAQGVPAARAGPAAQGGVPLAAAPGEGHRVQRPRQNSQGQGQYIFTTFYDTNYF
jgi:hypothetical protein